MQIYIKGLPSVYEPENVARLYFPAARQMKQYKSKQDVIYIAANQRRIVVAIRQNGSCTIQVEARPESEQFEFVAVTLLYELLGKVTGRQMPWGMLTGVRPVRMIHDHRNAGWGEQQIEQLFVDHYRCSKEKFGLAQSIANRQRSILKKVQPRDYSLYIGIPFCPSRCSYCSFVSRTLNSDASLVEPYVEKLCLEVREMRRQADKSGLHLKTIYIGGGTPTSLSAAQLERLMATVAECFDVAAVEEYTVEAGRPDCTDAQKLAIIKKYGASRIAINPQTFNDDVLARIGRKHSAADILRCFDEARAAGHTNINMDLIAGLPGDTVSGFQNSLETAIRLAPENITVHTLTLKRASNLVIENSPENYADVAAMLTKCDGLAAAGYTPYYLYRQKGTLQNLENTGWCKPGYEGYYNIYIMEEVHSILSAGAGGSTKLCRPGGGSIQRIFNYKYPTEYINGFDEIINRKEGVSEFYARYLDTETAR